MVGLMLGGGALLGVVVAVDVAGTAVVLGVFFVGARPLAHLNEILVLFDFGFVLLMPPRDGIFLFLQLLDLLLQLEPLHVVLVHLFEEQVALGGQVRDGRVFGGAGLTRHALQLAAAG